jgi:hypothetical protein
VPAWKRSLNVRRETRVTAGSGGALGTLGMDGKRASTQRWRRLRGDAKFGLSLFAAGLLGLNGCSDGCADRVVGRVDAPDGMHSAVLIQRDCGATTGFSTQISVLAAGEEPSGGGNAFRADSGHGAAKTGEWGGPWAEMRWLDNRTLLIRYASRSRLFEQRQQVSSVRITYHEVDR